MPAADSERIIAMLKSAIQLSNYTYRDVERQVGWRVGTITRLMRGGAGLKIEHLLRILRVIGFSPGRFFAAACPVAGAAGPAEDRLYRMLEQLHGQPRHRQTQSPTAGGATSQAEIDQMVRESLRKLLGKPPEDAP